MKADALNQEANEKEYTNEASMKLTQKEILSIYSQAVPYLEVAHEIMPQNPDPYSSQDSCYRLRDEPGMMEKYEKYNELYKQM